MDDSFDGRAALDAAAQLAADIRAELLGLFVEDESLFHAAALPYAQEVAFGSATRRTLDVASLQRVLRARAEAVRKQFEQLARAARVQASFRISRGPVIRATMDAAQAADLILIGRHGLAPRRTPERGGTGRFQHAAPIVAVFDGSPTGHRTLGAACALARTRKAPVEVFVTCAEGPPTVDAIESARCECAALHARGDVHATALATFDQLVRETRRRQAQLILISADHAMLSDESLQSLVANLNCPVGIVR